MGTVKDWASDKTWQIGSTTMAGTVRKVSTSGAGVGIPTFPAGGQVVLTLQCRVTASGLTP